jgi:hypothetical protein
MEPGFISQPAKLAANAVEPVFSANKNNKLEYNIS